MRTTSSSEFILARNNLWLLLFYSNAVDAAAAMASDFADETAAAAAVDDDEHENDDDRLMMTVNTANTPSKAVKRLKQRLTDKRSARTVRSRARNIALPGHRPQSSKFTCCGTVPCQLFRLPACLPALLIRLSVDHDRVIGDEGDTRFENYHHHQRRRRRRHHHHHHGRSRRPLLRHTSLT